MTVRVRDAFHLEENGPGERRNRICLRSLDCEVIWEGFAPRGGRAHSVLTEMAQRKAQAKDKDQTIPARLLSVFSLPVIRSGRTR